MKYGITLGNRGVVLGTETPASMLAIADRVEADPRFDSLWAGDAFMTNPRLDAIPLLAAVAGRTERVLLGPACMGSFVVREPVLFAYQWASLDVLSGGRTVLVACIGGGSPDARAREAAATGVVADSRHRRMFEQVAALRRLFAEDDVDFEGEFFTFRQASIAPKPLRQPYPIWFASNPPALAAGTPASEIKSLKRLGREADGWMSHSVSPQRFLEAWQAIRAAATAAGRDADRLDHVFYHNVAIADDRDAGLTQAKRYLDSYYGQDFSREKLAAWAAYGTPADIAENFRAFRDAGVSRMAIRLCGPDQGAQLTRLMEEVLPLV